MGQNILIFHEKRIPLRILCAYEKSHQVGADSDSHPHNSLFAAGFPALFATRAKLGGG